MSYLLERRSVPQKGTAVFVIAKVSAGEMLCVLNGPVLTERTRYSIEREGVHYDTRPPLRFVNHSCAPSAAWYGKELRALRILQAGEEVTFDYTETESEISTPFACRCGSINCRKTVGHLDSVDTSLKESGS